MLLFRDMSPQKGVFLTLALAVVGMTIFYFIGGLVGAMVVGNWDINTIFALDYSTADGQLTIRIVQMFQTFGTFLLPPILISLLASENAGKYLGFRPTGLNLIMLSVLFIVIFIPGVNLIASLNAKISVPSWMHNMEESAERLIKALLITDSYGKMFLNLFVVAVLPAIAEELFFRGLLQKYFIKLTRSTLAGVVVTSLIFSAIHFQFLGFFPRFLLGMVFGYLYVWTKSIWTPIIVHFVNNGLAVIVYFLIGKGIAPSDVETIGKASDPWPIGIFSLIVSAVLLWVIWSQRIKPQSQPDHAPTSEGP